jgi:hypothetical protein
VVRPLELAGKRKQVMSSERASGQNREEINWAVLQPFDPLQRNRIAAPYVAVNERDPVDPAIMRLGSDGTCWISGAA